MTRCRAQGTLALIEVPVSVRWLLVLGVAIAAGLVLSPLAPIAGLALLPAQQALARTGRWGPLLAGIAGGVGAAVAQAALLPLSITGALGVIAAGTAISAALLSVDVRIMTGRSPFLTTLFLPLANAAIERLATDASPFGAWGMIGVTPAAWPVLAAPAAWGGAALVAALITWPGSALVWATRTGRWNQAGIAAASTATAILAANLTAGAPTRPVQVSLIRPAESDAAPIRDGLAAATNTNDWRALTDASTAANVAMLKRTRKLIADGARVVVWSEGAAWVPVLDEESFSVALRKAAFGATVAAGVVVFDPGQARPLRNELWWVGPDGTLSTTYAKAHPVPGWEADHTAPGAPPAPFADPDLGALAGVICFDADFPTTVSAAARDAAMLVVPANDWPAISRLHADMSRMRAIELGVPVLRAADHGLLSVFDHRGRVVAETAEDTLTATVQVR